MSIIAIILMALVAIIAMALVAIVSYIMAAMAMFKKDIGDVLQKKIKEKEDWD